MTDTEREQLTIELSDLQAHIQFITDSSNSPDVTLAAQSASDRLVYLKEQLQYFQD